MASMLYFTLNGRDPATKTANTQRDSKIWMRISLFLFLKDKNSLCTNVLWIWTERWPNSETRLRECDSSMFSNTWEWRFMRFHNLKTAYGTFQHSEFIPAVGTRIALRVTVEFCFRKRFLWGSKVKSFQKGQSSIRRDSDCGWIAVEKWIV
jgi:hypothetical protein